jgi:hypothetical protein
VCGVVRVGGIVLCQRWCFRYFTPKPNPNTGFLAQLWAGKNILQCTSKPPRQTAAQNTHASALAHPNVVNDSRNSAETNTTSQQRATLRSTTKGDARAAALALAGIKEHCATSLLSLSFFQVHRNFQHPRQQATMLKNHEIQLQPISNPRA